MLSADDARQRTRLALDKNSSILEPFIEHIQKKVIKAADRGETHIYDPLSGVNGGYQYHIKTAVKKALEADGYTWQDHKNPDPGSPTGRDYVELSW